MRILWVGPNFLHPTTKGGQIRTLETLREMHQRHEIHYVAFADPRHPEGVERSGEYSSRSYPFPLRLADQRSSAFLWDLLGGLVSPVPVAVRRFQSKEMQRFITEALQSGRYDCIVCDFLAVAENFSDLQRVVLFQHNVESIIWRRRAEQAGLPQRAYLALQARRMDAYESRICRESRGVIAVSEEDASIMRDRFGLPPERVRAVPTGVNVDYFKRPETPPARSADLVFVGSMDWMPNEDGVQFFVREVLPLIQLQRRDCSVCLVGRNPSVSIRKLAAATPGLVVTGTVPDVRPYLWGARASIVPLRIGGGTRLKIYESAAAGVPVISTQVGAEGLQLENGKECLLADSPQDFAAACLRILNEAELRESLAAAAFKLVSSRFSWRVVASQFEDALRALAGQERPDG